MSLKSFLREPILKFINLRIWKIIADVVESTEFTIFWVSCLVVGAVLGLILQVIS